MKNIIQKIDFHRRPVIEYNVCKVCGAGNGRAGTLIDDECLNCHQTRKTGEVCFHAWLDRTQEEFDKTAALVS